MNVVAFVTPEDTHHHRHHFISSYTCLCMQTCIYTRVSTPYVSNKHSFEVLTSIEVKFKDMDRPWTWALHTGKTCRLDTGKTFQLDAGKTCWLEYDHTCIVFAIVLHKHFKHVDADCLTAYSKHFTSQHLGFGSFGISALSNMTAVIGKR